MKQRLLMTIAALHCLITVFAGTLTADDITMKPGDTKSLSVSLTNSTSGCYGVQFDMSLPDGFSLEKGSNGNIFEVMSDISCSTIDKGNGLYRFILYSSSLQELRGGSLMSVNLKASNSLSLGNHSITLNNVVLSDYDGNETKEDGVNIGVKVMNTFVLLYKVDGETYKTVSYDYGATITPEAAPTKEGYTFSGWSNIPSTMPSEDVTVTGSFNVNYYKLTYIVDGVEYKSIEQEYGTHITPEKEPVKDGCMFSGWSEIPGSMPAHDVTVTGTFTKASYILTYVINGETYKTVSYDYGATITPEAAPTKEGYTFSGWSWIPSKMPDEDVTITGFFTVNKYKLTYMIDGKVYKEVEMEYGARITPEPQSTGDFVSFSWTGLPETMPARDVTVQADYVTGIIDVQRAKSGTQTANRYDMGGRKMNGQPKKGVNIIRYQNGTTKKVVMK